jgi:uncharacterized protein (TIGR02145 family)
MAVSSCIFNEDIADEDGQQEESSFTIKSGTYTDSRDNRSYKTITLGSFKSASLTGSTKKSIGTQTWMAENLAYLPSVVSSSNGSFTSPYYYVYKYEGSSVSSAKSTSYYKKYGALYNWAAAKNACPQGWHLPSDDEWEELVSILTENGFGYQGSGDDIAKALASTDDWDRSTTPGTIGNDPSRNNASGFNALPGGSRRYYGDFNGAEIVGHWWGSNEYDAKNASSKFLESEKSVLKKGFTYDVKEDGYSIRCVKN